MNYRIFDGYVMTRAEAPSKEYPSMRSTKMFDTNGQEIYECDILEGGGKRAVVEWDDWVKRFTLRIDKTSKALEDASYWRVVGNAFQHTHLL